MKVNEKVTLGSWDGITTISKLQSISMNIFIDLEGILRLTFQGYCHRHVVTSDLACVELYSFNPLRTQMFQFRLLSKAPTQKAACNVTPAVGLFHNTRFIQFIMLHLF
jgi:hypothetical protein